MLLLCRDGTQGKIPDTTSDILWLFRFQWCHGLDRGGEPGWVYKGWMKLWANECYLTWAGPCPGPSCLRPTRVANFPLGWGKAFLWSEGKGWQCVRNPATTDPSTQMSVAWHCLPTETSYWDQLTPPLWSAHNKLNPVLSCCVVNISLLHFLVSLLGFQDQSGTGLMPRGREWMNEWILFFLSFFLSKPTSLWVYRKVKSSTRLCSM